MPDSNGYGGEAATKAKGAESDDCVRKLRPVYQLPVW